MIRIRIPEKNDYYKLQKKYLEMIKKYVMFDERDIIPGSDKNHRESQSKLQRN